MSAVMADYVDGVDDVAELYASHAGRIRRLVGLIVRAPEPVIEDACQFAWSRLIDHRAPVSRGGAPTWLLRTAVHEAVKVIRRDGRELSLDAIADHTGERVLRDGPDSPEELVEQRARLDSIRALPERQQRLVWLQGLGLDYGEMAQQTGATRRTVERQLLRAKHTLARAEN